MIGDRGFAAKPQCRFIPPDFHPRTLILLLCPHLVDILPHLEHCTLAVIMNILLALLIPVLLITFWLYTAHLSRTSFPVLRNKRICLLIAHPDDEAMFFSPTLLALTASSLGNHIKILCLSTGNNDGLGAVRQQELVKSAELLGLRAPKEDVFVLDSPKFPDSMTATWLAEDVAEVLRSAFLPAQATRKRPGGKSDGGAEGPPEATIDVLLTFDRGGVSGHVNHVSLYHGVRNWLASLMKGREGWRCPVEMYTLTSTNIVRKYISILDAPISMLWGVARDVFKREKGVGRRSSQSPPDKMLFVSDMARYRTAQTAMTQGHKSQMRWFRWGWIGVGRYVVVNDLKREVIP